jgi:hypothetical protein
MSIGCDERTREDSATAECRFSVRPGGGGLAVSSASGRPGVVVLDRATGDVQVTNPSPDDRDGVIALRAVAKLRQHWRRGAYPAEAWWAG